MNHQLNFIKLCDLYYQRQESSIFLDDNEVVFLNEEQIFLDKDKLFLSDNNISDLAKKNCLKLISNNEFYYIIELNFLKRKKIIEDYYQNYLQANFDISKRPDGFYIDKLKIDLCIDRDACSLTLIAPDKVQKRQTDLPRKATFLIEQSDRAYHFEEALKQWILLQTNDFDSYKEAENLKQVELLGAIIQDLSNLDVKINQDIDSNDSCESSQIQIDINKENQVLIQSQAQIRCIQLPNYLQVIEDFDHAYEMLKTLILTLYDDLLNEV